MSPSSPRRPNSSRGKRCSRSHAAARGAISSSAKRRARSRISRCSSVSSCRLIACAPPRSALRSPTRAAKAKAAAGLQPPAELLEAHDLPALLARDAAQLGVGVDDDRVADGPQHRQVGLRVRVGIGGGEVDALGGGQLAHRHRLALAVGEGPGRSARCSARRRPPSARPGRRRSSARGPASRPSPARPPCRCRRGVPRPGGRGRPRASAGTGAAARRPAPWAPAAAGRPRAGPRSSRRPRGARGRWPGRSSRAGGT